MNSNQLPHLTEIVSDQEKEKKWKTNSQSCENNHKSQAGEIQQNETEYLVKE